LGGCILFDGSAREGFQPAEVLEGFFAVVSAYRRFCGKTPAYLRALGGIEQITQVIFSQVDTGNAGGFAIGHPGNG